MKRRPMLGALALAGSVLIGLTVPAAAEPITVAATTVPCDPSAPGGTAQDQANANSLNTKLTQGLAHQMTAYRVSCAREILAVASSRGFNEYAATILMTAAIVESNLDNVTYGTGSSIGLFQLIASNGTVAQRLDPVYVTNWFLNKMTTLYPNNSWQTTPVGVVAQAVEQSGHPDRYALQASDGAVIAHELLAPPYVPHPGAYVNGGIDDLSGDGHADLLFADRSNNTVGYIPNNSNSNPNGVPFVGTSETKVVGMAPGTLVAAADISGDSYSDLLLYDPGQDKVFYYPNNGIAFSQGTQTVVGLRGLDGTAVTKILAADLTSDGHADLAFTTAAGNLYFMPNNIDINPGHLPYANSAILTVTGLPSTGNVALGYVTGDRYADLMFVSGDSLYFLPNNILVNPGGVPFAGAATVLNAGTFGGVVRFTAADVNGDNRADILWQDSNGTVYNLPNNTQLTEPYYTTTSTAVTLPIPNGTLI